MNKSTVYLAGKMTGLSKDEMLQWRKVAKEVLEKNGFKVLCPASTPLDEGNITGREIVHSNKFQIKNSDIVLAELDHLEVSIGTVSEIVFTGTIGGPVIAWGEAYDIINYPWVNEHITKHFKALMDALEYICLNYGK